MDPQASWLNLVIGAKARDHYEVTLEHAATSSYFKLRKFGGGDHHVVRLADDGHTIDCTCGDYTHRKAGSDARCKHGRALVEVGLIPPDR